MILMLFFFSIIHVSPGRAANPIGVDQDKFWDLIINTDPQLILLIDNRPLSYYEDAHIPGAINVPIQTGSADYLKPYLPDYSGVKILIYCNCPYGQNAEYQGKQFIELGYDPSNIYYLAESFTQWKYAVISGPDQGELPRKGDTYQTLPPEIRNSGSNAGLMETIMVSIGAIAIGAGALLLISSMIPKGKHSKIKLQGKR